MMDAIQRAPLPEGFALFTLIMFVAIVIIIGAVGMLMAPTTTKALHPYSENLPPPKP